MDKKLTLKIILLLFFSDILETLTHFLFKKGALTQVHLDIDSFPTFITFLLGVFSSLYLWTGLLSVLVIFIIWSVVLSKVDLSVAVPVASFSYILVPLSSALFLGEKVSLLRWSGVFFILIGVVFVSLSTRHKEVSS
ncbi:MAG: hypothetical protein FJZ12_00445 [Candidatus Omnitrophica bacterium]|nr:hypothetical protein [Candidatus Omnitrophota bacterium]